MKVAFAAILVTLAACKSQEASHSKPPVSDAITSLSATTAAASRADPADRLRVVSAPAAGSVAAIVHDAMASSGVGAPAATGTKRTLLVYVGARWCEPCRRFHEAAERGELDAAFPGVTLLEFDLDRDGERLAAAGYVSQYIPLLALPRPDGTSSGKQVEGGIKGDGAVPFITARLKGLLRGRGAP